MMTWTAKKKKRGKTDLELVTNFMRKQSAILYTGKYVVKYNSSLDSTQKELTS